MTKIVRGAWRTSHPLFLKIVQKQLFTFKICALLQLILKQTPEMIIETIRIIIKAENTHNVERI